jgi:hypothetical protein
LDLEPRPGAIGSTQPSFFNKLKPTIAASYRLSAETSTLCHTPDGPVKLTVQVFVAIGQRRYYFRDIFAKGETEPERVRTREFKQVDAIRKANSA